MNIIKLMSNTFVSYVDINSICCLGMTDKFRNDNTCCTLVSHQWLYWKDNFNDVHEIIRDHLSLIPVHYLGSLSYLNVKKIDVTVKSKNECSQCNSRTYISGLWLDWDEDIDVLNSLIQKAKP